MTTDKTNQETFRSKLAGYAMRTKRHAVHITAMVAGEERHYILPGRQFDRFATGHNVTGVNRDELNQGNGEEAYQSARCLWECGVPYLHDTLNDPMGESRVHFSREGLADLFAMTRLITFVNGREGIQTNKRTEEEIGRMIKREMYEGYVYPYRNVAEV